MGTVIIRRSPGTSAQAVRIWVTIDGGVAARLRPKHEVSLTLAAGTYQVQAGLQWSRSHSLELSVPAEGSVAVEVGTPWRLSAFSSTPGSLTLRVVDGQTIPPGYRRQRSDLPPPVFDPAAHRPTGRSRGHSPAQRRLSAFLKRRHPAWGMAFVVAGFLVIPVTTNARPHSGWIRACEQVFSGAAVSILLLSGMFVLGEWAARRDAARERRD